MGLSINFFMQRFFILIICFGVLNGFESAAHPDKVEDRLVLQFATGVHPPQDGVWDDLTHRFKANVHGSPQLTNIGPALALRLNGSSDYLSVATAADRLPKKEFTVAAWVLL